MESTNPSTTAVILQLQQNKISVTDSEGNSKEYFNQLVNERVDDLSCEQSTGQSYKNQDQGKSKANIEKKEKSVENFLEEYEKSYFEGKTSKKDFTVLSDGTKVYITPRYTENFDPVYEEFSRAYEEYFGRTYRGYVSCHDNPKMAINKSRKFKVLFNKNKEFWFRKKTEEELADEEIERRIEKLKKKRKTKTSSRYPIESAEFKKYEDSIFEMVLSWEEELASKNNSTMPPHPQFEEMINVDVSDNFDALAFAMYSSGKNILESKESITIRIPGVQPVSSDNNYVTSREYLPDDHNYATSMDNLSHSLMNNSPGSDSLDDDENNNEEEQSKGIQAAI